MGSRTREDAVLPRTQITQVFIDLEKKLPLRFTETVTRPDGEMQLLRDGRFKYPETGPADIYEAGAPFGPDQAFRGTVKPEERI